MSGSIELSERDDGLCPECQGDAKHDDRCPALLRMLLEEIRELPNESVDEELLRRADLLVEHNAQLQEQLARMEAAQSQALELAERLLKINKHHEAIEAGNALLVLSDLRMQAIGNHDYLLHFAQAVVDAAKSQTTIETVPEAEYKEFERKCSSELAKRQKEIDAAKEKG